MMHRVICNDTRQRHLQWIVVRDDERGPVLAAGPFADERTAQLHADALNRQPAVPVKSRPHYGYTVARVVSLLRAGWRGRIEAT